MRFMVLIKANKDSEAGVMPSMELLETMGKYNEELVKAGVLLAAEGLLASSKGARVKFSGDKRIVTDGPFAETKELIAGFWIFQVKSLAEAIEWVKRTPNPFPGGEPEIEIRQVIELEDFGPACTPELKEAEERSRRMDEMLAAKR
ncbi:MAG TPA: YciI family protein [Thermoanaerobaculia bacterium]|jgi:hypothetical protein|nr:YciI family protein [Thermoanaerobaculia bacterium]